MPPVSKKRLCSGLENSLPLLICLLLVSLLLNGCATPTSDPRRPPQYDPLTSAALSAIRNPNPTLSTFKGIGTYRLSGQDRNFSGRMAWAVQLPDRMRIAILDATGKPLTVVATDGQWLYVDARREDQFYKKRAGSVSLEKMVGIDISVEEVITVLTGGVPIEPHRLAQLINDTKADGCRIELFGRAEHPVQNIWCQNTINRYAAERFTVFQKNSDIRYEVELNGAKSVGEATFFQTIVFSDHHNRFRLEIDRIWAPAQIDDALFKLEPR